MMRHAAIIASTLLLGAAAAQDPEPLFDPGRDDPAAVPAGPNELDILSEGEDTDFPDIDDAAGRKPVSVTIRALNKITAKYTDIVINMDETAKYGALEITPRYCDKRPPEEFPETTAFVEIVDKSAKLSPDLKIAPVKAEHAEVASAVEAAAGKPALPEDMIFSGWMFASSPALNGVEHAVYDVWVIDCKTVNVDS